MSKPGFLWRFRGLEKASLQLCLSTGSVVRSSRTFQVKAPMLTKQDHDWLQGGLSLAAATGWTPEEVRLVTDLGYSLAEQGRHAEAITVFEGLAALVPATLYFQSALGALKLRIRDYAGALPHLNRVLAATPDDAVALVNRGETLLHLGDIAGARADLQRAVALVREPTPPPYIQRARALLMFIEQGGRPPARTALPQRDIRQLGDGFQL
jgi:tetratricopeptide (TPR) repeat protein